MVAFGHGNHILFTNLASGSDSYYRADSKENGDGVSCLTGHKNFPIFAFAELGWNARIFILSFPDFAKVSVLESMLGVPLFKSYSGIIERSVIGNF